MRGNFGLNLQNRPKLPHKHARFYCNANEQSYPWKRAIKKQVFLLLLQCQIKWQLTGQSNQQEHAHCVLPAETQWEVTNLWLTVPEIVSRNANASNGKCFLDICSLLSSLFCFQCFYRKSTNYLMLDKFLKWNQLFIVVYFLSFETNDLPEQKAVL